MSPIVLTLVLLMVASALWYGGRAWVSGQGAPKAVSKALGDHPRLVGGILLALVIALITMGLAALLALLIGG